MNQPIQPDDTQPQENFDNLREEIFLEIFASAKMLKINLEKNQEKDKLFERFNAVSIYKDR